MSATVGTGHRITPLKLKGCTPLNKYMMTWSRSMEEESPSVKGY